MSATQATAFNNTWIVLQQSTPDASGFCAVLLQNRSNALAATSRSDAVDFARLRLPPANLVGGLAQFAGDDVGRRVAA